MSARIFRIGLLLLASAASADDAPFVLGSLDLSRDTDGFRSEIYSAGGGLYVNDANPSDRFGYRRTEIHYSAPGFAVHGSSNSLFANKLLSESTRSELSGELTHSALDNGQDKWLGWTQYTAKPSAATNAEVRYEKNWIDSRNGIEEGITYAALTAAGDWDVLPRVNLAGVIGRLDFSDGNRRPLYRAKANLLLSETYGVSLYVRGRKYSNSDPYTGNYFSPESYREYLGGISLRRRLPVVRGTLAATIDWGRQNADGTSAPAHTWRVSLESWRGAVSYSINTGTNATGGVGGGADYEYRYTSASLSYRF